jgi:thymidylate kinase
MKMLKIVFYGKDGSGKSKVATLLARQAEIREIKTLEIGSDESGPGFT